LHELSCSSHLCVPPIPEIAAPRHCGVDCMRHFPKRATGAYTFGISESRLPLLFGCPPIGPGVSFIAISQQNRFRNEEN
jgi:hypothetical protein